MIDAEIRKKLHPALLEYLTFKLRVSKPPLGLLLTIYELWLSKYEDRLTPWLRGIVVDQCMFLRSLGVERMDYDKWRRGEI